MAQGTLIVFEEFSLQIGQKLHDLANDVIKVGLVDSTVTPLAADATPAWADYSANEVGTGGAYVAGGLTLSGVTYTEAGGVATLDDTGNISLAQNAAGFTDAYWAILYNSTLAGDQAFAFVELGGPVSEVAGPVAINWGASGILTVAIP